MSIEQKSWLLLFMVHLQFLVLNCGTKVDLLLQEGSASTCLNCMPRWGVFGCTGYFASCCPCTQTVRAVSGRRAHCKQCQGAIMLFGVRTYLVLVGWCVHTWSLFGPTLRLSVGSHFVLQLYLVTPSDQVLWAIEKHVPVKSSTWFPFSLCCALSS